MIFAGIIGCGTIGSLIAETIVKKFADKIELAALCDIDREKAERLLKEQQINCNVCLRNELIAKSDLVIEAASVKVSYEIAKEALIAGKDVLVMSTGGLLGKTDIFRLADRKGARIYLPSGALCGLDGVKGAMAANVDSVILTTRKPPAGLRGAPYIKEKGIDLDAIKDESVVFEGTVEEAINGFPKNINVAATLSYCGIGATRTLVRIITSPNFTSNSHEIEVRGDFGTLRARTENMPMPDNPKTSYLAALSAIAMLKDITSGVIIGN